MVRISVIIPTRDRAADLQRCMAGLADCVRRLNDQSHAAKLLEVIVVDDASSVDISAVLAESGLPVALIRNASQLGAGASRRFAVESASGDVFAFLDDDAVPRGDWLIHAAALDKAHPAITGRVLRFDNGMLSAARQARYDARYARLERDAPVSFFAGGNSSILATSFHAAGGFSREGVGGDNSLADALAERGTPVCFRPELVIAHRNGKGWRRAFTDAWSAGRHHPQRMTITEGWRTVQGSAVGPTWTVAEVNMLLGAVHAAGRVRRRPAHPSRSGSRA
jgi:glycosyltransferase involved in cell wall biosynthesis